MGVGERRWVGDGDGDENEWSLGSLGSLGRRLSRQISSIQKSLVG